MAKARFRTAFGKSIPRLAFREQGDAKSKTDRPKNGARNSANSEVRETALSYGNKAQSFKTVFLGDSNVGKTCLTKLFVERRVVEQTTNTIGFDHHVKEIEIEGGVRVNLQVWDTAGMEQFRNALITKYYRNTDGIVFVFDITRKETFESLERWVKEVKNYVGNLDSVKMMLVGNMKDKEHARKVSVEEAEEFRRVYGMVSYQEVSAKSIDTLQILDDLFVDLAKEMIRSRERVELTQSSIHRSGIITLSDEWEIIDIPVDPVPQSVHSPQDATIRLRERQRPYMAGKCLC